MGAERAGVSTPDCRTYRPESVNGHGVKEGGGVPGRETRIEEEEKGKVAEKARVVRRARRLRVVRGARVVDAHLARR